jgi:Flp pilus assembly protein TadG
MIDRKSAFLRRSCQPRRGTHIVELALILPVFLIFIFATLDFAQIMWAYGTVSEAARTGARYAMVHGSMASSPVGPSANDSTVQTQVQNNALALDTSSLTVTSSWPDGDNKPNHRVTVTASYDCHPIVGSLFGVSNCNVVGTTTMLITH